MGDFFMGHYAYWFTIILLCIGLYGILFKKNLGYKAIRVAVMPNLVMNHDNMARGEDYG